MGAIRAKGNKDTELLLISVFRKHKITGWRRHLPLPGRPDFTFRQQRVVIFIDGCFWHACKRHFRMPSSNTIYWERKFSANQKRDRSVTKTLRKRGWRVLRIWEHELQIKNAKQLLRRIQQALSVGSSLQIKKPSKSEFYREALASTSSNIFS